MFICILGLPIEVSLPFTVLSALQHESNIKPPVRATFWLPPVSTHDTSTSAAMNYPLMALKYAVRTNSYPADQALNTNR